MFKRVNSQYYAHMRHIHPGERYKCWTKTCGLEFDDIQERDLHQDSYDYRGIPLFLETIQTVLDKTICNYEPRVTSRNHLKEYS